MFDVLGRLLVAASTRDPEVKRELDGFPEGFTLGFSVLGDSASLRLRWHGARLTRLAGGEAADLDVIFKHVSHAFMVLSFQESTPSAFANQRLLTQGDAALAMRFTRCLNRVQAVTLPRFVAARALKAVPPLPLSQKLALGARLYAGVARGLGARRPRSAPSTTRRSRA
jgi:SCP-2 sterol transfer family